MLTPIRRETIRRRIRHRIRRKLGAGTARRPRVAVFRSARHIYAQAIDDTQGKTVASASSRQLSGGQRGSNIAGATAVGAAIAERLKQAGVEEVIFDRGGFLYHGRVKALAEAIRSAGVKF